MASSHTWAEPGTEEVAPGIHRIPLPLPNDGLHAVNVYAIEDGDGVVLIDSGWALTEAQNLLESALGGLGFGFEDVRRFLVTHVHRDHYTMAVALRKIYGTKIALGIGEQPALRGLLDGKTSQLADLVRWGADGLVEDLKKQFGDVDEKEFGKGYELPDEWLDGSTEIALDKRNLRAVPTPGHTNGHVVFADQDSGLLFAGDHILPHITPSIGFQPVSARLPLGDYLDSLRLMRQYPDMRLLPAHGPVAPSVHTRVDELLAHHDNRLAETLQVVADGAGTAFEAARRLGWTRRRKHFDDLDLFNRVLAIGETAAHLDVLVAHNKLTASTVDGVVGYAPPPTTS